jgi:hypothetical protein
LLDSSMCAVGVGTVGVGAVCVGAVGVGAVGVGAVGVGAAALSEETPQTRSSFIRQLNTRLKAGTA